MGNLTKTATFRDLNDPRQVVQLDLHLTKLFTHTPVLRVGDYTGNGQSDRTIDVGIKVQWVYIQALKKTETENPLGGDALFAVRNADGVAWLGGTGYRLDLITKWTDTGFIISSDAAINDSGRPYRYFAIG